MRGLIPTVVQNDKNGKSHENHQEYIAQAIAFGKEKGLIQKGDRVRLMYIHHDIYK